jgi:nicotinate phosphoribosyltransferase
VTAPLPQAQLIETRLINLLQFQTLIASKAARCILAAPGKALVDFGLRRAHGAEAGCLAARASYLAGFSATSNVLAGCMFKIPLSGTMAHSFIQAHADEAEAFESFARANPQGIVFLLDTYDTEAAAHKVVELSSRLKARGLTIHGVRLDSGDLIAHALAVREILDEGGLGEVHIFASGDLDEYELQRLIHSRAPIDGFGIGSRLDTSADTPYLNCVYKIQECAGASTRKLSERKATWPGRKQVYRMDNGNGRMNHDVVALESEHCDGEPLLQPVMREGRRIARPVPLEDIRERIYKQLMNLPPALRRLEPVSPYRVEIAESVRDLAQSLDREHEYAHG